MALLNNVVAYWKFDDAAPGDYSLARPAFRDATGRGNDLTVAPDVRPAVSTLDFRLGANNAGNQRLDGALAGWGIWKRKLTAPEKAALAGGEKWPFSTTTSLQDAAAYFLLDEASGSSSYADATGRGNDLARSGTTTQVTGPLGTGFATNFTPGAYLHVSPTADLQGGGADHTIAGWVNLNNLPSNSQSIIWGQCDINSSPARTGDIVYCQTEGGADGFSYDLGNDVDLEDNGVVVIHNSPSVATWYFLLAEYDKVSSIQALAVNNGTRTTFPHNYFPGLNPGKIRSGIHLFDQPQFDASSSGWDGGPRAPFLIGPNNVDTAFRNASKTVWCWFKADSTVAGQIPIAGFYDSTSGAGKINWMIFLGASTLIFYVGDGTTTNSFTGTSGIPFSDTASWHLLVCWYDEAAGMIHMDLDHGTHTSSGTVSLTVTPSTQPNLIIGSNLNAVAGFETPFAGSIDEMGIANGVPVSTDLDALWNGGSGLSPQFYTARLGLARLSRMRLGVPGGTATIIPDHFTLPITFPPPTFAIVPTIAPTHFTLPITFPPIHIGPRFSAGIQPAAFKLPITFPPPAFAGGRQTLQVFLGGINVSKYVQMGNASGPDCTLTSQTQGRWTAQITLKDVTGDGIGVLLPTDPTRGMGQSVIITEGGQRRFMGCANDVTLTRNTSTDICFYTLNCVDKSGICDHRIVNASYTAEQDGADVVRDIWENCLNGEGITLGGVPAVLGQLGTDEPFNFTTVTQAFNKIATDCAATWWIDVYGSLFFVLITDLPAAPFSITETSQNWRDMQVSVTLANYRNKEYALSNLSISPGSVPSTTESYTLPQPKAAAAGYRLGTIVLDFPASQILGLSVNGVPQVNADGSALVQDANNSVGINLDKSWNANLPSPYINAPDSTLPTPVPPLGWPYPALTSPFPAPGDVIVINYIPNVTNVQVQTATALAPSLPGLLKCGSGIYEAVEQVQNIKSADDLLAIAQAVLNRSGTVPLSVQFNTFTPGLAVGQILAANVPKSMLPDGTSLIITGVTGTHLGYIVDRDGNQTAGHGSAFKWAITAITGGDQLVALLMFEKLIARTQNPLPIVQFANTTFVLGAGSSIAGGLVASNPNRIGQSGKLVEIFVQAGVPPTDQTLFIDIVDSAFGTILRAPIQIVSGDGSPQVITAFVRDPAPTYLLVNQSLSVVTSYVVTGANPALAGSVTVDVVWAI